MGRLWKIFVRVLRSYTIEEKVISVIALGTVIFLGSQLIINLFHPSTGNLVNSTYTEGLVSEKPAILNPLFVDFSEANRDLSGLIFSGLSKYDPEKQAFIDDMAVLKVSPDRKIYKFTLKDNLKWHDGEAITADDVYFTFHDLIQNPDFQNPILRVNFEGIEIKQDDAKTVEFLLKNPNAFFITNMNVGILPKHILKDTAITDLPTAPFNVKPIGSGPYKIDAPMDIFDDNRQRVTLNSFDQYYGEQPKIKQIHFSIYPDNASLAKEKNAIDLISKIPTDNLADFQASNRFTFSEYELPQYTGVFFNTDRSIVKIDKVRVALLKAVDKTELLKLLSDKTAVDTPLLELNQADWIYKPSVDEAKGGLYDSGYAMNKGEQFRKNANGNVLKLTLLARAYNNGTAMFKEVATVTDFLKKSWQNVGVQLDVQFAQNDDFNKRLTDRNYDLILTGQNLGYNLDTYSFWHSSQATALGLNLSNYKSFAADKLIEQIRDIFDPAAKAEKLKGLAKALSNDVPAIFLYRPKYIFASDNKIKGISLQNMAFPSDRFAHIELWSINN